MRELFIIALAFILLDIVSGLLKAFEVEGFNSSTMRHGLYHKCAEILLMLCGVAGQYAVTVAGLENIVPVAVFQSISVYVIAMEIVSILENVSAANPSLNLDKLLHLFGQDKED